MSVNTYEVTFILGEEATEKDAQAKVAELEKYLGTLEGSITKTELWGRRELAYKIRRHRSGFYTTIWITLPAKQVATLEKQLRFDESVIRSLVTVAYTTAQPGSLYPVVEEEAPAKPRAKRGEKTEETVTAEEELRRTTKTSTKKAAKEEVTEDEELDSEEDRLKKLDEALGDILTDEE